MHIQYRPDIDGLRALAVLAVVFYHADFVLLGTPLFPGGFIGVDVFFVISGYLITSIILRELTNDQFRIAHFYERRIRRILPALFVVMAASWPAAWLTLLPKEMKEYAGSVVASLFFGSNIWFWTEDSYTAEPSMLKPFLHTWSLSVEEQFYVIFPLLLILLWRFARRYVALCLAVLFIASLLLAQTTSLSAPDAAFYLLPSRGWELLAGALLAHTEMTRGRHPHPRLEQTLPALGLLLVIGSFILFDHDLQHPSLLTAVPVIGVMLMIWFAGRGDMTTRFLSSTPMVGIGLISYSLYLWHFPILAFARILGAPLSDVTKIGCILLAFALSVLTYRYVERPARDKTTPFLKLGGALMICTALLLSSHLNIFQSGGAPDRLAGPLKDAYQQFQVVEYDRLQSPVAGPNFKTQKNTTKCRMRDPMFACEFGDGKWVTLGDSFVGHYESALYDLLQDRGEGLLSFNYDQCPLLDPLYWFGDVTECPEVNQRRWERIRAFDDKKIFIIAARYGQFRRARLAEDAATNGQPIRFDLLTSADPEKVMQSFKGSIEKLLDLGHTVVLIHNLPNPGSDVKKRFFRQLASRGLTQDDDYALSFVANAGEYKRLQNRDRNLAMVDHPNLIKIYPRDIMCPKEHDQRCLTIAEDGALYHQEAHLSYFGAARILKHVFTQVDNAPNP